MQAITSRECFVNKKTISRLLCVQVMYAFIYRHPCYQLNLDLENDGKSHILSIAEDIICLNSLGYLNDGDEKKMQFSVDFFNNLLHVLATNYQDIRGKMHQVFQEKTTHVLRDALILVSVAELIFYPDTTKNIIINDFLKIAKGFGVEQGVVELLNAVLERVR
ncbi:Transcription antitermination protein NusB [Rickettsiales endosymbiont of Paramecium tredecaurelia]|uniref:transcription antitermination factor NusB n=1 Tax=Candidatus Sarmatiella mevalonica TaxID=2770581 RepID=UPI0019210CDF|nr:transcription antitermination factor NusB [Candidatus Sarmatiella mevalonica]MBL3285319.1 Transcription antitermination protein NusB [Candidatus Sarmatiella mevalonica]